MPGRTVTSRNLEVENEAEMVGKDEPAGETRVKHDDASGKVSIMARWKGPFGDPDLGMYYLDSINGTKIFTCDHLSLGKYIEEISMPSPAREISRSFETINPVYEEGPSPQPPRSLSGVAASLPTPDQHGADDIEHHSASPLPLSRGEGTEDELQLDEGELYGRRSLDVEQIEMTSNPSLCDRSSDARDAIPKRSESPPLVMDPKAAEDLPERLSSPRMPCSVARSSLDCSA